MELKVWSLYRTGLIILLVFTFFRMYELDGHVCVLKDLGIVLNGTCAWSDWLSWDCACCNVSSSRPFAVRKRAICCAEGTTLEQCISGCGYSEHSDRNYGNCSTGCGDMTTASGACVTEPPTNDTVLLPLHTKGTTAHVTTQHSSTLPKPSKHASELSTTTLASSTLSSTAVPTVSTSNPSSSTFSSVSTSSPLNSSSSVSSSTTVRTVSTSSPLNSYSSVSSSTTVRTVSTVAASKVTTQPTNHSPRHDTTNADGHSINLDNSSFTRSGEPIQISTETPGSANETSEAAHQAILTEEKSRVGVILGAVFGSLVGLGAVAAILFLLKRAKRKTNDPTIHPDSENQPTDIDHKPDNDTDEL